MSGEPMALRPHHGMCMAYFVGFGYSDGFSRNMTRLLAEELTPDRPVRLTVDTDQVCAACPRSAGGRCDKPELVAGYDRAVLELCGLTEGGGAGLRRVHRPGPKPDPGPGPAPVHLRRLPVERHLPPDGEPVEDAGQPLSRREETVPPFPQGRGRAFFIPFSQKRENAGK